MNLSENEKAYLEQFILENSGIQMGADRMERLEGNLKGLATKENFRSYYTLIESIKAGDNNLITQLIDLATINETHFMRDNKPFTILRKDLLPKIIEQISEANSRIRIWCAACSKGQEAYSVAISLLEEASIIRGRKIEIIATDICSNALDRAKEGVYNQFEVQRGLPATLLIKYFSKVGDFDWKVKDEVKNLIHFTKYNLVKDTPSFGAFHVIFCRNVLIYFEDETKEKVVKDMSSSLKDGGSLFLGTAETRNHDPVRLNQDNTLRSLYHKK